MHGLAAVLLGAPLILRMAAFEESKRLEADLVKIQSIRKRRDGVRSVGKSVGH